MNRRPFLRQTLDLRLSQRLALTPSLLQKIELLQLNKLELQDMLNQELVENPILEEVLEQEAPVETALGERAGEDLQTGAEPPADGEKDSFDEIDFRYFFDEYLDTGYKNREVEDSEKPSFETFLTQAPSLEEHLNWQLGLSDANPRIAEIAGQIIGNLNEDGYLIIGLEELCAVAACTMEEAVEALNLVQAMDPLGVGARDLRECLSLQLQSLDLKDSLAYRIVQEHLPLLEGHKLREIAARSDAAFEEVLQAVDCIKHLIPKPGQKYNNQKVTYVQPEVTITKVDDEFVILVNDEGMPQLRLNSSYKDLLRSSGVSSETKAFLRERFRSAVDLLRSVNQRKQTIYKVCVCVVNRQKEFLENGPAYLRPMLIKDVAAELGVHSSTISRVVTNKYVDTPQGVMELRKFFTMGVENPDGGELSIVQVKLRIKKLLEEENRKKPYSDNQIGQLLRRDNIFITRRTVAKYREQMQIPGSRERKIGYLF
ncbi:MAG TPA: RNA polymerase factor sigma-54 [Acidobacteriota bacterium]|nr:RNA polymerase factor sigma-54 [Acidobacteriota bacterium]